MKIHFLMIAFAVLLAACNQTDAPECVEQPGKNEVSSIRSVNEAIDMALTASEAFYPSGSRGASKKVSNPLQVKAKYSMNSRSGGPLYYVVNFDDEMGFAIVPAAADNERVLAITESGNVDPNLPIMNEGFQDYLYAVEDYLSSDVPDSLKTSPFSTRSSEIQLLQVEPRVTMLPNQYYPENGLIPIAMHAGYAGCGPVALLMAMSFVKEPTELPINFPYSYSRIYLNWNDIALHRSIATDVYSNALNPNCMSSNGAHEDISAICREIGYSTNSTYTSTETVTQPAELYAYIRTVMPSNCYFPFENGIGKSDLDAILWDGIVIVEGWNSSNTDGHYWIVDGIHRYVYYNGTDVFGYPQYGQLSTVYYHFNWGWGGSCNGYFSLDVYDPNLGSIYDGSSNSSSHHYSIIKSGMGFLDPSENKYQKP